MSLPDRIRPTAEDSEARSPNPGVALDDLYRILVENVPDYAIFVLDPDGHVASWNAGAERIKGWTADEIIGRHYRIFFPADVRDTQPDEQLRVATRDGRVEVRGWRRRKDGTRFWAHVVLTALYDGDELLGFGKVTGDRTAERAAQQELARRERQLEEAQQIAHLGSWELSADEDASRWSDELFRIFGLEASPRMKLSDLTDRVHPADRQEVEARIQRALEGGDPYVHEHRVVRPDGDERWVQSRAELITDDDGVTRLIGTTLDITELKRAEEQTRRLAAEQAAREEAERTAQRMGFLAEASALLSASLDMAETLRTVAWLAVPAFADWCAVDLVNPAGDLERLAIAHMDPEQVERAESLRARFPPDPSAEHGVHAVLRTGEPQLYPEVTPEVLDAAIDNQEQRAMVEEMGLDSALLVPIRIRERSVGVVSFVYSGSDRHYTGDDLVVARELASRAGLAIENAQLHTAERDARDHAERTRERVERLQSITAELSEAVTPDSVAGVMVDHGAGALGATSGALVLVGGDGSLEMVRSIGIPEEMAERYRRFDPETHLATAAAIRTGQLVVEETGASRDERYPDAREMRALAGTEAAVAVPLLSGDGVIGSLGFGFREQRTFSGEDRSFLQALGRQCAQALERAWLYETEHVAREAAEEASRAKSQFVAMMSHELRTPLSAIIGYQELLSEQVSGPVNQKQGKQLTRIRAAALHLRDLINQILSLSRIEAGSEEVNREDVDLVELVDDVIVMMTQEIDGRDLDLAVEVPVSLRLETDPAKVRQILINLLSNAVKFTAEGGISLIVEPDEERVRIHVRDTGIGIAAEDQERIFEVFTQVDQSMTRSVGGSGLGLAVSRRLAELLGGSLELESEPGDGSTFTLTLPR